LRIRYSSSCMFNQYVVYRIFGKEIVCKLSLKEFLKLKSLYRNKRKTNVF
jgi:hypothetical protein